VTTGYATFAGGGKLAEPYTVLEIRRPNGDIIYDRAKFAKPQKQAVPEEKIAELNSMLKEVVKHGTARRADLGFAPQGGKTGTNQSYRDAWYVGFTAHNVTGVWVGNDDFSTMKQVTGGLIPAPAWKRIMEVAEAGERPSSLAGIPLDDTYAIAATDQAPDGVLVPDDESGIVTIDTGNTPADASGVAVVLNDMFSLFEKKPVKKAEKPKNTKVAKSLDETLVLPGANAKKASESTFMEDLFIPVEPDNPKKKKKKKKSFLKKLNPFD
jgi:membrane peptidoglycan carboxypeptidase